MNDMRPIVLSCFYPFCGVSQIDDVEVDDIRTCFVSGECM